MTTPRVLSGLSHKGSEKNDATQKAKGIGINIHEGRETDLASLRVHGP